MCVVALAISAHPNWRLVVAGNRDEYHARESAPLARWNDGSGIIAGRDLVSGGSWMGVSDGGRFAVVTNIRDVDGPKPDKLSRGALVSDWLADATLPNDLDRFNPFNLIVTNGNGAEYLSNRPTALRQPIAPGIHGLSNAIPDEHWPRKDRLIAELAGWLQRDAYDPELLFDILRDEAIPDRDAHPVFIKNPVYGTRCSTVIVVDHAGNGQITERCFDPSGTVTSENHSEFCWPAQ
jgi:uncharacterized protein with NRDE domain